MTDRYPMALTPPGGRKQIIVTNADEHKAKMDEWGWPFEEGVVPTGPSAHREPAVVPDDADALKALRHAYQEKFGKRPFMGWDADTIRSKLVEVGQ